MPLSGRKTIVAGVRTDHRSCVDITPAQWRDGVVVGIGLLRRCQSSCCSCECITCRRPLQLRARVVLHPGMLCLRMHDPCHCVRSPASHPLSGRRRQLPWVGPNPPRLMRPPHARSPEPSLPPPTHPPTLHRGACFSTLYRGACSGGRACVRALSVPFRCFSVVGACLRACCML